MAYSPDASASERVMLDGLRERGITWVRLGQLRGWIRKGLPRVVDVVADFALLIDQLGPRHTDQALLVIAGAWPELMDPKKVASAFTAWFERQFGAIADDPKGRWRTLYYRMSRAGGARRRARQLPSLGATVERDLRGMGYAIDEDKGFWSVGPNGRVRFDVGEYLVRWADQLPAARRQLSEASDEEKLTALREGFIRAVQSARREDTPLHALDVLVGQDARRPLTKFDVLMRAPSLVRAAHGK